MENFDFYAPTKMLFGKGKLSGLAAEMAPYGKRVLLVYGGGSIKRNGIYDRVCALLSENGFTWEELSGVTPNPKIESVRAGAALAKQMSADMVLTEIGRAHV